RTALSIIPQFPRASSPFFFLFPFFPPLIHICWQNFFSRSFLHNSKMKSSVILSLFFASALAQDGCGFPDGPDCVSLGEGANGLEQFADDGCCLLPIRCGNGDGGERCE
ncbi:hypothetical protein BKA56DRAFT_688387, partial [Ilyonectria sp. MPI-CAGE-AT-0026]